MAYIGNTVQNQGFAPAVDYFNGDGTTVTFTLSRPVASVAQLTAVIENVIQNPSTAFTVSGSSITFTSAPPSGTNNIWVEYTSLITTYAAISQDPTVIGDITATGGYSATGDYGNSFVDGVILDYVTGNARITTGASDGITLYNGGTSSRSALMTISSTGNLTVNAGRIQPSGSPSDPTDSTPALYNGSGIGPVISGYQFAVRTGSTPSERMRVDLSGNVGIGTSSPISNGGYGGLSLNGTSGALFSLMTNGTESGRIASLGNETSVQCKASTGYITFVQGVSGGTERMRIDASGRVTMPYQPGFYAYKSNGPTGTSGEIVYNATFWNTGSAYNTSTGRFTAPISGYYLVGATGIPSNSNYCETAVYRNNSEMFLNIRGQGVSGGTTQAGSGGSCIVYLNANDYISASVAGANALYGGGVYTSFFARLIG